MCEVDGIRSFAVILCMWQETPFEVEGVGHDASIKKRVGGIPSPDRSSRQSPSIAARHRCCLLDDAASLGERVHVEFLLET